MVIIINCYGIIGTLPIELHGLVGIRDSNKNYKEKLKFIRRAVEEYGEKMSLTNKED